MLSYCNYSEYHDNTHNINNNIYLYTQKVSSKRHAVITTQVSSKRHAVNTTQVLS